jgi:hypothetical protein
MDVFKVLVIIANSGYRKGLLIWLGWAYLTKKVPHTATPRPSQPHSKPAVAREKRALESPAGAS